MKTLLALIAIIGIVIPVLAQNEVRIVYVDNSRPKSEGLINDNMINRITSSLDEVGESKEKFVLFMSNGSNYAITDYYPSVDKMLEKLYSANSKEPDQYYDVKKMRDMVYKVANGHNGKVIIDYYITGSMCSSIPDKAAPLFAFLPREIAALNNNISVEVNVYYPATYKIDIYRIKSALEFYDQGQFASNVDFNVTPL